MQVGIYTLTDLSTPPFGGELATAAQRTDDVIAYGVLADTLGLDAFGVGEHHSPRFAVSSPAVVLAAVAQATQRIRLLSTATVLTALDPVRVFQDYATVDLISHGRAEIVAGRSAFAEPLSLFGVDLTDFDATFTEKLDLLLRIRDSEEIDWEGKSRPPLRDAAVVPRGFSSQLPVWLAVGGTPSSAARAGHLGLPMMLAFIGGNLDHISRLIEVYRVSGDRAGHPPEALQVGVTSHFYAAEDSSAAREQIFPYYRHYLQGVRQGWDVSREQMNQLARADGALMVGGVDELIEKISVLNRLLGVDQFLGQVDFGGLPRHMVESSVELLGTRIKPGIDAALGVANRR